MGFENDWNVFKDKWVDENTPITKWLCNAHVNGTLMLDDHIIIDGIIRQHNTLFIFTNNCGGECYIIPLKWLNEDNCEERDDDIIKLCRYIKE